MGTGGLRDAVVGLPEGQSCSITLHPIGCGRMDLGVALAENLPTLANPVVGAVQSGRHNPMDVLCFKV